MKNISLQKSIVWGGIIAFWLSLILMCSGAFAQSTWTNIGNGLQTRVVSGFREYRFITTTGYQPFNVTDSLNNKQDKEYTKTVTVGDGGDYTTLAQLFSSEAEGKTLIKLTDSLYDETNPSFIMKKGWKIQGEGMGKTIIRTTYTELITSNSGFQIRTNCELSDFTIESVNNIVTEDYNNYAIHSDINEEFKAVIERVYMRSVKADPHSVDASGSPALLLGIGTWDNQVIEFRNCILEGQTVAYDSKSVINSHNTLTPEARTIPSRLSFYNCKITGGFNSVFINDTYNDPSVSDLDRIKDVWEFLGCTIQGGINFRSLYGHKNGFIFNFSGTTVDEIRNSDQIVDTDLANYTSSSLPNPSTVEYWLNKGASPLVSGDLVSYVYADREPYWNEATLINTPVGIEKLTSANKNRFAGVALVNSGPSKFTHISTGGIAYVNKDLPLGSNLTFDENGELIATTESGVGYVMKKLSTSKSGLLLTPNGKKSLYLEGSGMLLDAYKNGDPQQSANVFLRTYGGTRTSPSTVLDGERIATYNSTAYNGVDADVINGQLGFYANGDQSATNRGATARILVTPLNGEVTEQNIFDGNSERIIIGSQNGSVKPYTEIGSELRIKSFTAGGFQKYNYAANSSSRSWRVVNDYDAFGDFAIQQSTTQTGGVYVTKLYITPDGEIQSSSDVEVTDNTKGIILKSPDGTRYRITVENGGTLTVTAL